MGDPSEVLSRTAGWTAALRERGLVDEAAAARLDETLAESRGERLDCKDDPLLVVMLCGPTAVGKSSLINALAGADISRQGLGATTGAAVFYVHEQDDPARLLEYGSALGRGGQQEATLIRHRRDELLHKVLVDTPDIDSVMRQHEAITAGLVHAADLVLFVTSPEKYKVLRSARWVLEQRQQRAIAFVLNKWDRGALGVQRDRRNEIEADFRDVLAGEGYSEALVFKVSALTQPRDGADVENELPALRAWLETGISTSTAAVIQQRRLLAAWGRLALAIEPAVPRPLSSHAFLPELTEGLAGAGGAASQSVGFEASMLNLTGLEDSLWPVTPGLLGAWIRTRQHVASALASLRSGFSRLNIVARAVDSARQLRPDGAGIDAFGATTASVLSETMIRLAGEAAAARLPLGPTGAAWTAEACRLERQLATLPVEVVTALTAEANRPSFRRWTGMASVYAVEGLIGLILLVTVGRLGIAFVSGSEAPNGLLTTALELIFAFLVIGHITAGAFFPPLPRRARRRVAERAKDVVSGAVAKVQKALREQLEAADRLADEGGDLLLLIDRIRASITDSFRHDEGVDRLFGVQPSQSSPDGRTPRSPMPALAESAAGERRRPFFD